MTSPERLTSRVLRLIVASATVYSFTQIPTAFSQGILEEIVVTAQKREESILDIPISISAFTGNTLEEFKIVDTRDLQKLVPGFTVGDSGFNTPIYTMRGVGFNETTYTAQSTVGVYLDEISLPYTIMTKGPILDVERVEVLKGPQGIFYGRNTTGGAINYIANKPTDEFDAGISMDVGRFQTTDVEAYASGPISDTTGWRLAVRDIRSQDGSQDSVTRSNDSLGEQEKTSVRAQLSWQPTQKLRTRLSLDAWQDKSEPRAPQAIQLSPQVPSLTQFVPNHLSYPFLTLDEDDPAIADWPTYRNWRLNDSFYMLSANVSYDLTETVEFTTLLSYAKLESDGSSFPQAGTNYRSNDQVVDAEIETVGFEARLAGVAGNSGQFTWLVGVNYSKDDAFESRELQSGSNTALVDTFSNTTIGIFDPPGTYEQFTDLTVNSSTSDIEQYAAFANGTWDFAENFTLSLGARYTQQEQDFVGCSLEPENSTGGDLTNGISLASLLGAAKGQCFALDENFAPGEFAGSLDEDNVAYRAAIDWKVNEDSLIYVSYSRGYKSGGFPNIGASNQLQYSPVTQEEVLATEVGVKTYLADRQLRVNAAVYYYDYKDKQLFSKVIDPLFGPLVQLDNAPESEVQGFEIDVAFAPNWAEGLLLSANYAYTDTEVIEFVGFDFVGQPTDFSGRPFNFAPESQYTLIASYGVDITDTLGGFVSVDYSYSDETNATLEGATAFAMDSYGLLGARIGIESNDGKWSASLYGRNLTDEYQATGVFQNGDVIARYAGQQRFFGLSVDYFIN
ncbi:TonB-dependent receptor [Marinobacter salarius]|uniref:TonB-dependent receptor n=1 Tax=Marinobacter salarius TaxID=1420917 RepID=UPI0032ED6E12